jgi:iron complex transport system ATP-binding protein
VTAAGAELLTIAGVSAGYRGRPVVHGLSVPPLRPGEILSLLGPNAAGKSTLLRALAGLLPARGTVRLGTLDLHALPLAERARFVGFMPQSPPQGVALTVLETVITALRVTPFDDAPEDAAAAAARALAVLERIGIAHLAMEGLDRLSGGQRQLASLAQALARGPRVLLLDEPTSALDLRYQLQVMKLVREVAAERGMIVVVVLHDLALAARWSDHVVVLSEGRVAACGTPAEAITPAMLAQVYGVTARVECPDGVMQIVVEDLLPEAARPSS